MRRYLMHAIRPGTPFASAARLRMHGEIKLGQWLPFRGEQVIRPDRGFVWNATVPMYGMPIRGFDRLVDGAGAMRWRQRGLIPIMTASGPDITRSAAGRMMAELTWMPSAFLTDVDWSAADARHVQVRRSVQGEPSALTLTIDDQGRLESIRMERWGNPGGGEFRYADFGGIADQEATFAGYTIPSRLRVGWYFGTERFATEGEFFRVTLDDAAYR